MYLDCDTSPPLQSRSIDVKRIATAVEAATLYIKSATEGQIGIYDNHMGGNFYGYVIKRAGQEPEFEPAQAS